MNGKARLEHYKDSDFDKIIRDIQRGVLKTGKYANLVKIKGDRIKKEDMIHVHNQRRERIEDR